MKRLLAQSVAMQIISALKLKLFALFFQEFFLSVPFCREGGDYPQNMSLSRSLHKSKKRLSGHPLEKVYWKFFV